MKIRRRTAIDGAPHRCATLCLVSAWLAIALAAAPGHAAAPEKSLARCAETASRSAQSYQAAYLKAASLCFDLVGAGVVGEAKLPSDALGKCVGALGKLRSNDRPHKTAAAKIRSRIAKACDPALPGSKAAHTAADVLGSGASVAQPLDAESLGAWCAWNGGDGNLDSVGEWISCVERTAELQAQRILSAQYPRLLEWSAALLAALEAMDPACFAKPFKCIDPGLLDAYGVLGEMHRVLDGQLDDDLPDWWCPDSVGATFCGLVATGQTQCADDGVMGDCPGNPAGGQDGDLQNGVPRNFVNNGDGTISDHNTGLVWEVHCDEDSEPRILCPEDQDMDTEVTWYEAMAKVERMNKDEYAGYDDWRLPNAVEARTLVDYGRTRPALDPVFLANCRSICGPTDCSCAPFIYSIEFQIFHPRRMWTSTTEVWDAGNAYVLDQFDGVQVRTGKDNSLLNVARAVRGGF